jgi:hypothetical protein
MPSGEKFNKNFAKSREVIIDYTNYRGERAKRRIKPIGSMVFIHNEWHPEQQWLMLALDVEKNEKRFFAMKNIHSWEAT